MAVLTLAPDRRAVPRLETTRTGEGRLKPIGLRFRILMQALQQAQDRGQAPSPEWGEVLEGLGLVTAAGALTPMAGRLLTGWRRRIRIGRLGKS
jgi:hypothetical protein